MDDLLFNIPIYLRSEQRYEDERKQIEKNQKQKSENLMKETWGRNSTDPFGYEEKWPPWEYNDIIGYYRVIINSSNLIHGTIRGITVEKYFTNYRRIGRRPGRRVSIWLNDPFYHCKLSAYRNSVGEIKHTLLEILDDLYEDATMQRTESKRYYIDVEYYKRIIECLDIEKFRGEVNKSR